MENLELKLLEEVQKLERYNLKNPVDSKNFWKEWQVVYSEVKLGQIAIRSMLGDRELKRTEVDFLKRRLNLLRDIEIYLKELKEIALQIRGYSIFSPEESGEGNDDTDIDDLLF